MFLNHDIMYQALLNKDSSYEGTFIVAVKTTNIFCRPTCTARKPKKENVEFFTNSKDAILNGYRPCKICKPLETLGATPDFIQILLNKIIENPNNKITDYNLFKQGIEPNKVRRWFKSNHGLTFQGYQRMMRINNAFHQLKKGDNVLGTAFDNGFDSVSGFTEAFKSILGKNPSHSKYVNIINAKRITTPIGPMLACADENGICMLEFTDRRMLEFELKQICNYLKAQIIYSESKYFPKLEAQLSDYFNGNLKKFELTLNTPGTEFQKLVWQKLCEIPYGETRSYKQQSILLNNPLAIRAVARANGFNRISIIIPCHRVIGEDGSLTGYGGGLPRKKWLLDFEKNNSDKKELF